MINSEQIVNSIENSAYRAGKAVNRLCDEAGVKRSTWYAMRKRVLLEGKLHSQKVVEKMITRLSELGHWESLS